MENEQGYTVSEELLVFGIPVLDTQHANLVRICNNLRTACLNGVETSNNRFQRAVQEAADYARYHFSTEEKLMSILEYPDFYEHKREHGDFVWEILSRSKQLLKGEEFLPEKFVHFISEWIENHTGIYDKAFSDYFISMKHHGKLKLILGARQILSSNLAQG